MADFGVARFLSQGGVMTAETGTYKWMAPEVFVNFFYLFELLSIGFRMQHFKEQTTILKDWPQLLSIF